MQQALLKLAPAVVGISTMHYLGLNEAVATVVDEGLAGEVAGELRELGADGRFLRQCCFCGEAPPEAALYRLTQSSAVHRQLAAHPDVAGRLFAALESASGLDLAQLLKIDPSPLAVFKAYDPKDVHLAQMLDQMEAARECLSAFMTLPKTADPETNWVDDFQPAFHMLLGSLMMLGAIDARTSQRSSVTGGELIGWFAHVRRVSDILTPVLLMAKSKLHGLEGGALTMVTHGKGTILGGPGLQELVGIFVGIDEGLGILEEGFRRWSGPAAQEEAQRVLAVRTHASRPLLKQLRKISGGAPS